MCAWPLPFALLRGRSRLWMLWDGIKTVWWAIAANKRHWEEKRLTREQWRALTEEHSNASAEAIRSARRVYEACVDKGKCQP